MKTTFPILTLPSRQSQNGQSSKNTKHTKGTTFPPVQHDDNPAEFINVTQSVDLDKSSKTRVRVQVMKDYHRRRTQKVDEHGNETLDHRSGPPRLSAKAQTQKFRLGQEKILRPWKPKKRERKKDRIETTLDWEEKTAIQNPSSESPGSGFYNEASYLGQDTIDWSFIHPQNIDNESSDFLHRARNPRLSSLKLYPQSSTLHLPPSNGMLDPFLAMSLPITPRIQRLLHHYCKHLPFPYTQ